MAPKTAFTGLVDRFLPAGGEMCQLRADLRHRAELLRQRVPHVLHIQKALPQMNLQLTQVLRDVMGVTGMAILRARVAGERDGVKLAPLRNPRCKSSEETIAKALTGNWKDEDLFVLKQSLELYDFYTHQVAACDAQIPQQYTAMKPRWEDLSASAIPVPKPQRKRRKNEPASDGRTEIIRLTGVDLVAVGGLSDSLVQTIISDIGTDVSKWPTEKHFASGLGLAPHNDISGGKILRSRTLPTMNRAGQAFRQAAVAVSRSHSALGAYYRRKRAQRGPQFAQVATAHKIARTVYYLLKHRVQFVDIGADAYEQKQREREVNAVRKKAAKLGFALVTPEPTQALA